MAYFIVDLGCEKTINGFYLRNTHNAERYNRGTGEFTIFSQIIPGDQWKELVNGELEEISRTSLELTNFIAIENSSTVRFVKFQVDSFYGSGGGLQYFAVNEMENIGESYSGDFQ